MNEQEQLIANLSKQVQDATMENLELTRMVAYVSNKLAQSKVEALQYLQRLQQAEQELSHQRRPKETAHAASQAQDGLEVSPGTQPD